MPLVVRRQHSSTVDTGVPTAVHSRQQQQEACCLLCSHHQCSVPWCQSGVSCLSVMSVSQWPAAACLLSCMLSCLLCPVSGCCVVTAPACLVGAPAVHPNAA